MKIGNLKNLISYKWGNVDILIEPKHKKEFEKRMIAVGEILDKYNLNEVFQEKVK